MNSTTWTFGVELADGTRHTFTHHRVPKHWKSWVMQQCEYGTVFLNCRFYRGVEA